MNRTSRASCSLFALVLICCSCLAAWGQAGTSRVRGAVTDPQERVISGATVTIKNSRTGYSRTQTTTNAGVFSFESIPPADYTIEVSAVGFRTKVLDNVHALVGAPTDANAQMDVGASNQTIVVKGEADNVLINTQDATLGNNIGARQITTLPLESRDILSLLTLQPGVTPSGEVAGARSDQSNITLDGVDINEAETNSLNSPVLRLNADAIEEFRVNTVNANANQGRSSAAQIDLITKTGTNGFHGVLFEQNRNTIFTANDFFLNRAGIPRPVLNRNTFGGEIDGPIIKNKLFFMYSYEGRRDASQTSVFQTVPLPVLGQGQLKVAAESCTDPTLTVCSQSPQFLTLTTAQLNQAYPSVGLNPAAIAALADAAKKYPANDYSIGDGFMNADGSITPMNVAGFRFNSATPVRLNSNIARLDWNITGGQTAYFRFNAIYDHSVSAPQFPDTPKPELWSHPYGFVAAHTLTIGPHWVNSARYGLTREMFSQLGDSTDAQISFRNVFSPRQFSRTVSRATPVHNIIDDVTWIKGAHTIQFGANVRLINNIRINYEGAYDSAITNSSAYIEGADLTSLLQSNTLSPPTCTASASCYQLDSSVVTGVQDAATALIGRLSGYSASLTYGANLQLQPVGTPSLRDFATQEYDAYIQDAWKIRRNLTLSYGLRYGLSRPIYETHGFEVQPNIPLGQYFQNRVAAAKVGMNYDVPLSIDLSGPVNGGPPLYNWDYKNFQPRVALAWAPTFENGFLRKLFGGANKSVIRGGFAVNGDYYGEALAAFFDTNNTLGFSGSSTLPGDFYNITTNPAPLFTGFNQNIRSLPNLALNPTISFPQTKPVNLGDVESSLDSNLVTPKEYTWNLTYERELPAGLHIQVAYIGRMGHHLLAQRDVMAQNDLVDPRGGGDWYTNASRLEAIRQTLPPPGTAVPTMPYFDHIFPSNLTSVMSNYFGVSIPGNFTPTQTIFWIMNNLFQDNDWADFQYTLDDARIQLGQVPLFFQPQYGGLQVWSTIGNSNYNGLTVSVRQRFHTNLLWDFNYTYSHSLDDASGLQTAGSYSAIAFIQNPFNQRESYANSSFDLRHVINVNGIYDLPFGRGEMIGRNI